MKTKKRGFRAVVASITLAGLLMSGCYGSFGATKLLYNWNGSLGGDGFGGRFLRTLVMWVFVILPVYEIFMFGDFFILNLIEFFTGTPLLGSNVEHLEDGSLLVKSEQGTFKLTAIAEDRFMVEKDGVIIGEGTVTGEGTVKLLDYATATEAVKTASAIN